MSEKTNLQEVPKSPETPEGMNAKGFKKYWELFWVFAMIGGTTFGGGYAMLPILQREIVDKRHWATEEELMDYYAIGQCTPGIIAVNTATFIGYKYGGIFGGIIATLGVVFPSMVIITIIAAFLTNFADLPAVKHAFNGIRAGVFVLVLDSVIKLAKKSVIDTRCWIIFLAVLAISLFTSISPVILVIAAGIAGILFKPDSNKKAANTMKKAEQQKKRDANQNQQEGGSQS